VVDNGTDDEDEDDEPGELASQGPNSPEVVARRLHGQVLELERVQNERDTEARMEHRKRKDVPSSPLGKSVETAFDDPPREPDTNEGNTEKEEEEGVSAFALAAANLLGGKK
jgi:hypothetical protein